MRSVIRPAIVGIAAVGMAFVGAASASACGSHEDPASVTVNKTSIEDSFNSFDFFSHNFNNTVVFGDVEGDEA